MLVKAKCWEHEKEWGIIKLTDEHTRENGEVIENISCPTVFFYGARIWNNERENFESRYEYKISCKEMENKECNITLEVPYEEAAVTIEQIMDYMREKISLYDYDLSREEFKLRKIRLIY